MVRIPAKYQEVEYLESTGTQYIKTNYTPTVTENMKIEMDYMFTKTQSGDSFLFGAKVSGTSPVNFQCEHYNNRSWYCGGGLYQFRNVLYNLGGSLNKRYSFIIDGNVLKIDGNSVNSTTTQSNLYSVPLYIFAANWNGATNFINKGARIYNLSFTANGVKEADFIPCYRKSDSEPGMYDTVSGTFFTNAGTGTFIVGNDVSWEAIDLLALRRMVMLSMASGAWKKIIVTAPDSYANAKQIADWLTTIKPDADVLFALRDAQDTLASENGTLLLASFYDNVPFSYIRVYGGNRDAKTNSWSTAYSLSVDSGDKYTILYQ